MRANTKHRRLGTSRPRNELPRRGRLRTALRAVFTISIAAALSLVAVAALAGGDAKAVTQAAPVNTGLPTISGSPTQGSTLTATTGTWSGTVSRFEIEWRRCGPDGGPPDAVACLLLDGQTATTYTLTASDVGSRMRVRVSAINESDSPPSGAAAASDPTALVTSSPPPPPPGPPVATSQPSISGTPTQGQTLTGTNGTWANSPTTFNYQWVRCGADGGAADGSNCAVIGGANSITYLLAVADVGNRMRLQVRATNSLGTTLSTSNPTSVVTPGSLPTATQEPVISGTPQQGKALSVTTGTWTGSAPITFSFQWRRCGTDGGRADAANCAVIPGATRNVYVPTGSDVNRRLRARVTATNSAGTSVSTSNPTATVKAPTPPGPAGAIKLPNGRTSIPVTSVSLPNRLVIDGVRFTPNPVRTRNRRLTMQVHVSDTRGYVVRNTLVFVRSTPILTNPAPELRTRQDGWVTFSILPRADFPLRNGYNVQFFVRARKAGDNVLAGVSTRRLVQVRTANR